MKMKYITVLDRGGLRTPMLFPACISHEDFAALVGAAGYKAVSAGFVSIDISGAVVCSGRSESLGLQVDLRDPNLIYQWMKTPAAKLAGV